MIVAATDAVLSRGGGAAPAVEGIAGRQAACLVHHTGSSRTARQCGLALPSKAGASAPD